MTFVHLRNDLCSQVVCIFEGFVYIFGACVRTVSVSYVNWVSRCCVPVCVPVMCPRSVSPCRPVSPASVPTHAVSPSFVTSLYPRVPVLCPRPVSPACVPGMCPPAVSLVCTTHSSNSRMLTVESPSTTTILRQRIGSLLHSSMLACTQKMATDRRRRDDVTAESSVAPSADCACRI